MGESLNFSGHPGLPMVDFWGAEAERLALERPDLSLIRARQLTELFVYLMEFRHQQPHEGDLKARIKHLKSKGLLPVRVSKWLNAVRKTGNDAVHIRQTNPPRPEAYSGKARVQLLNIARAWAWLEAPEAAPLPRIRLPQQIDEDTNRWTEAMLRLDSAEDLVDRREYAATHSVVAEVRARYLDTAHLEGDHADLVALRCISIETATRNHQGLPPQPMDEALVARIWQDGDGQSRDELVHYLNRRAVSALNVLDFSEVERIQELIEWRNAVETFAPGDLAELGVMDWQRGALLGTLGQSLALRAHAHRDPSELQRALQCFANASACFDDEGDLQRQDTYRMHALLETLRLGDDLDDDTMFELRVFAGEVDLTPLDHDDFSEHAFRVAHACKACWVLDERPKWIPHLSQRLLALHNRGVELKHPYGQLRGWACVLDSNCPRGLRAALKDAAEPSDLLGWILSCYLAQSEGEAHAPEPPPSLKAWWDTYGIGQRGPLEALPYNYA